MKKIKICICCIILSVVMLYPAGSVSAALGKATVTVDNVTAQISEDDIIVPVSIENNTGICGATLTVSYDEGLVLKNISGGDGFASLTMTKPGNLKDNPLKVLWDGMNADSSNGKIMVLTFENPKKAGSYAINLSYKKGEVIDDSLNPVDLNLNNGSITVEKSSEDEGEKDHKHEIVIDQAVKATCNSTGLTEGSHCKTCSKILKKQEIVPSLAHQWKEVIDKSASKTETGIKHEECSVCHLKRNESTVIPKLETTQPELSIEEAKLAEGLGLSPEGVIEIASYAKEKNIPAGLLLTTDKNICSQKSENIKYASFHPLFARATSASGSKIALKWNKIKGANGYIIYGNKCGTKNKFKKIKDLSSAKTSYSQSKLKKGTFYKYVVVAYKKIDGKKITIAASKTIYATTTGGRYGNSKSVKVSKPKVSIMKNKTYKLKASEIKKDKKLAKYRAVSFESSNTKIAVVNSKGKITGKAKGSCYIYVYAQNGIYSKVKVSVK